MDAGREVEAPLAHGAGPAGAGGSATKHLAGRHMPGPLGGLQGEGELEPGWGKDPPSQPRAPRYLRALLDGGRVWWQHSSRGPFLHVLPVAGGHQHLQPWGQRRQ